MTGFDVDHTGNGFITRELGAGSHVKTGDGSTLTTGSGDDNTNCDGRTYGVNAIYSLALSQTLVAFIRCTTGTHVPIVVEYRQGDLSTPNFPTTCGDFCLGYSFECPTVTEESGGSEQLCYANDHTGGLNREDYPDGKLITDAIDIADIASYPIDYSRCTGPGCPNDDGNDKVYVAGVVGTTDGRLRVYLQNYINNDRDALTIDEQRISQTAAIDQICSAHPGNGDQDLVYASTAAGMKGYFVNYYVSSTGIGGHDVLVPDIRSSAYSNPISAGADAISCGGTHYLFRTAAGKVVYGRIQYQDKISQQFILNQSGPGGLNHGVALDSTGIYGAYIEGNCILLFSYDTNQTKVVPANVCIPIPGFPSQIYRMRLTDFGKQLYLATNDGAWEWDTAVALGTQGIDFHPDQNVDSDEKPDVIDPDTDGDGVCNTGGPFPAGTPGAPEGCTQGTCRGTDGQVHDCDENGDGVCNAGVADQDPSTTSGAPSGCRADTRAAAERDSDGDGIPDFQDPTPYGYGGQSGPSCQGNDCTTTCTANGCVTTTNGGGPGATATASIAAAYFGVPIEDGLCLFCMLFKSIGMTSELVQSWMFYLAGFAVFGGGIFLASYVSRRNNTRLDAPANGMILGGSMGAAFVFFAFPGWIILLCFIFAAVGVFLGKKFTAGG